MNDFWASRPEAVQADETWEQRRHGAMPTARRRGGSNLALGLLALSIGAWGLWLLLETPILALSPTLSPAPTARPLVFQVPTHLLPETTNEAVGASPSDVRPGLKIVLTKDVRPTTHPETWGALPTTPIGPVAATPLADIPPRDDTKGCRDAPTLAAQMTCIDPALREAEGRMAAAYDAVLAAGVSPAALGRSQARWLASRDAAALSSPEALLAVYLGRESQLRTFAVALTRRAASVGMPIRATPVRLIQRTPAPAAKAQATKAQATKAKGVRVQSVRIQAAKTKVTKAKAVADKRDKVTRPSAKPSKPVRRDARLGRRA